MLCMQVRLCMSVCVCWGELMGDGGWDGEEGVGVREIRVGGTE